MAMLKFDQVLRGTFSQLDYRVRSMLGDGGQGEVYMVEMGGQMYALKWYNALVLRVDRGLYSRLKVAIDRGAPSGKFLWPFELVTLPDGSGLGYLMRLRRPTYLKIHSLLSNEVMPPFRVLATMGCLLTDALFALHAKGLAYQDLNAGNVFFDATTGDIEICDNDNVDIDGAPSVIGGVWEYQAPEVVLRQAGPTRATDLHSLAVMLFKVLHMGHPLMGQRELAFRNLKDEGAIRQLFGTEARFIYDPHDESNRPVEGRHGPVIGHWKIYPQFLRDLFTRAFTEGLYDPMHGRVQETEWRRAMSRLRDSVMTCPHCHSENFYDGTRLNAKQATFACWGCGATLTSRPARIGIRRIGAQRGDLQQVVILEPGTRLFAHHLGGDYDFSKPLAEVVPAPPGGMATLRNHSQTAWTASQADGSSRSIVPGASVAIAPDTRVAFGRSEGEIKV